MTTVAFKKLYCFVNSVFPLRNRNYERMSHSDLSNLQIINKLHHRSQNYNTPIRLASFRFFIFVNMIVCLPVLWTQISQSFSSLPLMWNNLPTL